MKNRCEKHHFTFEGNRCPICEKERIAEMVNKFIPRTVQVDKEINKRAKKLNEILNPDISWEDLQDKFNVIVKEKTIKK